MVVLKEVLISKKAQPLTACKQYCLAAGATQGNIAYTQNVSFNPKKINCEFHL